MLKLLYDANMRNYYRRHLHARQMKHRPDASVNVTCYIVIAHDNVLYVDVATLLSHLADHRQILSSQCHLRSRVTFSVRLHLSYKYCSPVKYPN